MEEQCSPLSWGYCYQEEGMEELKHTLLYTTLELETTLITAKEEITRREFELIQLKDVLSRTIKERDEAQARCQKLMLEKLILHQQLQHNKEQVQLQLQLELQQQQQQQESANSLSGAACSSEDEDSNKHLVLSSSSDRNIRSIGSPPVLLPEEEALKLAENKPLPEKGKLLQAVKDAGPLLQNLLLAGPLPQWQHPPPQLSSIDIPPVAISSPTAHHHLINANCLTKKRATPDSYEASDSSPNTKYSKLN